MTVAPLAPPLVPKWYDLFRRASCPCHCRYWNFEGTKNDWLDRCANAEDENAREQRALVEADAPEGRGLVALDGDLCVGWMKLGPRPKKLRAQSAYRSLPLEDDGVLSIGCFLVDPEHRRRGVVHALLEGAKHHARSVGARAIEGYPRKCDTPLSDDEAFMGPIDAYLAAGFQRVEGAFDAYPVFRFLVT